MVLFKVERWSHIFHVHQPPVRTTATRRRREEKRVHFSPSSLSKTLFIFLLLQTIKIPIQNPSKPSIFCLIWAIIVINTFVEDFIYKERNPFGNRERKKSRTIVNTVIVNKVVESFFLFLFFVIFLFSYVFFLLWYLC